ncbi:hypothetical protein AVEN_123083-1 [Araneus ventricosus]|uniref:Uncharacterized protein n=1 Tax=Araneus ventricosus TaxID=182803 RepID=A0A4Y2RQ42_ARAVE|nr:hypothetical protein AVEN_123083-1 [Araneus ventricosus]
MKEENKEVQGEMMKFCVKTIPETKLALCRSDYSKYVGDLLDICFGREGKLSDPLSSSSQTRPSAHGIRLGWFKAHIGIKGNEISDTLAKEATTNGLPASLPFPKIYLKPNDYSSPSRFGKLTGKMVRLADRFTALLRKYQTNSCTGPENASNSTLVMAPSPPTSRDSVSIL